MPGFAGRLKEIREKVGLSQYALAKRSGLSKQALSSLELGLNDPTWETVQLLSTALGISSEQLRDPNLTLPAEPVELLRPGRPPKQESGSGDERRGGRRKACVVGEGPRPPVELPARHDIPLSAPADAGAGRGARGRRKKLK